MAAPWMARELPREVRYGIEVDPMWEVNIATLPDGREYPNLLWSQSRHAYTLSFFTDSAATYALAKGHWMQARGRLAHWPFKDPVDHRAVLADGAIVQTAGGYRLAKVYGLGSGPYVRTISRPVGAVVHHSGVPAVGVTVDPATGYLSGMPGGVLDLSTYAWVGEFRVPVRYDGNFPNRVDNRKRNLELWIEVVGIQVVEVRE